MEMRMRWTRLLPILLSAAALLMGQGAAAQSTSSQVTALVVPFAPGGGHDSTARILAPRLAERLGHSVIVENRPGANGMVGADYVARAKPDGRTILLASPAEIVIAPSVYKKMNYDPMKDLAPVTLAATTPVVIVANPSLGVRTLADVIALAKRKPEGLAYGTPGEGSSQHLAGAWLAHLAGIKLLHVPYKGAGPATNDVVAGHIPLAIVGMAPVLPFIRDGKLVAIAVTSPERVSWAKEVPAVAESPGMKDFAASHWMGIMVPGRTPADIVQRLQADFAAVLKLPDVRDRLAALGVDPVGDSTAAFRDYLAAERSLFAQMYKFSGLTPE
ncbi:MAG: tripartite tricarboxylate transporter substrate binding protein [Reyranella sp.]|nr:MAG: tripartite tricarboxylate transporter substrate binding protein [Reyranella sp.]TBR26883.1 MAG: tripartite tricarboxylate transporter substrate binding protein [Reyranella sp.]